MRIGLDMLSIQAAGVTDRSVSAYSRLLTSALLSLESEHQFILYGHDEYPRDAIPDGPRSTLVSTNHGWPMGETSPAGRLEWLSQANPDRLDWLLILDPLGPAFAFGPPARPLEGPKIAAVVPDLTPFLLPERDLIDPDQAARGYRALVRLRQYDAILTPTAAARDDALTILGIAPGRVFTVGGAAADAFAPEESHPMPLASRRALHALGIRRAFVLADAGRPGQNNVERAIRAFGMLPEGIRRAYQLVIVGPVSDAVVERARADNAPPRDETPHFTGEVQEDGLRTLFQHCAAFVHPALHEGFGQSILEAMLCGAAVVAGNNSAQAEIVGDAGLLVDPSDAGALAGSIARIIDDWPLSRTLRERAASRARLFTPTRSADAALDALGHSARPRASSPARLRADRPHRSRPRIAFFSPLPPRISGIADYAARLIGELKASYVIDLYHDAGYLPDLGLSAGEFAAYDGRLFDRNDSVLNYHAIVYQLGNSVDYHGYLYDTLLRHPGVVTLHDFFLSVYPYRGTRTGEQVRAAFRREIRHFCPDRAEEFVSHVDDWCEEEGGLAAACARRGLFLNRRAFEGSLGVVVHSPWCLEQVRTWMPEHADKTVVIPLGASTKWRSAAERAAIRGRFGLPQDALVVSSFGFIHPDKLVDRVVEAFHAVAKVDPSACFLCVGDECDGGVARRKASELGLDGRVRFLGRRPATDYDELIAVTDLGINLRRPPTNGETSAALLDLLASGVATVVTDVATFADYPDNVVRKVRWDARGPENLRQAMLELAVDREAREALGASARSHVRERHAWGLSAARYVELIERCAGARGRGSRGREARSYRPHASAVANSVTDKELS